MVGVEFVNQCCFECRQTKSWGLWTGEPVAVLEAGAATCRDVYGVPIAQKFDLAVASLRRLSPRTSACTRPRRG